MGFRFSLGRVAIPEIVELEGGGGGGGGGTLDCGEGCWADNDIGCWSVDEPEEARWWLYELGEGILPGVVGWLEWLTAVQRKI